MARLAPKSFPLPEPDYSGDWRNSDHEKAMNALYEKSKSLPDGEIVGAVLNFQRCDNYARYIVVKAEPLTVAHIPYMDGYTVEPALIRGLKKEDVLAQLHRDKALRALFAKK